MTSADFEVRTEAFLNWFKSLPGSSFSDSIKIVDLRSRNAGRGIIAMEDIEPDTTLFTIPRKGIINAQTSEVASKLPSVFDLDSVPEGDDAPQQDSWSSLILVMIYEFLQEQSTWKPYFDVLPESFDTPMFWSVDELSELQASSVRAKVGKAEAEDMFRANILPIIRQNPELFVSSEEKSDEELVKLAHRMGSTIMAYAFDLENEDEEEGDPDDWVEDRDGKTLMGMVPMADILNADAEFNAHANHGDDDLTVTSLRVIKAGEEVLNYYGPHPNSELLRRYGYVTPKHSRYDVVEIPWDIISTSFESETGISEATLNKARETVEEEEDIEDTYVLERDSEEPKSDGTFASPASFTEVPEELTHLLKRFIKVVRKLEPGVIPEKRKREDVMLAVLLRSLQTLESRYPTSLVEDENVLQQEGVSQRRRMAIEVRKGEKKLLREAKAIIGGEQEGLGDGSGPNKRTRVSS